MDAKHAEIDLAVAKACGCRWTFINGQDGKCYIGHNPLNTRLFDPSGDTDEAMRLAAELGFDLSFRNGAGLAVVLKDGWLAQEHYSDHSGDKLAAMRWAICRAVVAAAAMEGEG